MQMNRSDLLLRKRNAPEQRQKRGCRGSTELPIVVPRRSWREISCGKLGTLIQQTKNSLNFVSTCLKVVDTRRNGKQNPKCRQCGADLVAADSHAKTPPKEPGEPRKPPST